MQLAEFPQTELQSPLNGDEPLLRGDLIGQGPQKGCLAGIRCAGNHDVLAGMNGRGAEGGQPGTERAQPDQLIQTHPVQPGSTQRERRTGAHIHDRRQARPVGQPQVQLGISGIERTRDESRVRAQDLDQLDELVVGIGHGGAALLASIGVLDEHIVATVDIDVLHLGILQQRLKTADPEQGGVDPLGDLILIPRR